MARLVSKNQIKVDGPWLLTKENLNELHSILEKVSLLIEKDYNNLIDQRIEEITLSQENINTKEEVKERILTSYEFKKENKATLTTTDGEELTGENLYELLISSSLEKIKPTRITSKLKKGQSEVLFNFSELTYFGGVEFKFSIDDDSILEEVKYQTQNWIDKYKPKKAVKIWSHFELIGSFLLFLLASSVFLVT